MLNIHKIRFGIAKGYVNCYLLETETGLILIDTGIQKSGSKIWKYLNEHKLNPEDVKLIIITHGHLDHTGGLKEIKERTKAKILIHEEEVHLLEDSIKPEIVINAECSLEEYGINGKIIPTPGHSKGSITVILEPKKAFIGDIAMKIPVISPSYKPIIAENMKENFNSWQKLIDIGIEELYPAHGKIFNIKELEKILNKRKKKK